MGWPDEWRVRRPFCLIRDINFRKPLLNARCVQACFPAKIVQYSDNINSIRGITHIVILKEKRCAKFVCLLFFYILATSKVMSGLVPTCDS